MTLSKRDFRIVDKEVKARAARWFVRDRREELTQTLESSDPMTYCFGNFQPVQVGEWLMCKASGMIVVAEASLSSNEVLHALDLRWDVTWRKTVLTEVGHWVKTTEFWHRNKRLFRKGANLHRTMQDVMDV